MLTLVGTFIDARWRQNPQSRPPPSRSEVSLRSSDGVRKYGTLLIPHWQERGKETTEDLLSHR